MMSKFSFAALCVGAAGGAALTGLLFRRDGCSAADGFTLFDTGASRMADGRPTATGSMGKSALPHRPGPAVDPAGVFRYGFPGPVVDNRIAASLVSAYDRRTRNPFWVAEHITPESLATKEGDRSGSSFQEDDAIPAPFRARLSDYFRSGFDRGHQVPAADAKWSQAAMDDTFLLSNICPQVGEGFNRDYWAHLEDFCRRLTRTYPSVRIVTGPLYLPKRDQDGKWRVSYEMIGSPPNVAVPTHFFKVIYAESSSKPAEADVGPVAVAAFVLPNTPIPNSTPLTQFEVPIEMVEKASGLEFAALLPAARRKRLCADGRVNCSIVVRDFSKKNGGGRK